MKKSMKFLGPLLIVLFLLMAGWAGPLALADPTDKATLGGQDSSGNYHWRVDLNGNLIPGTDDQNNFGDGTHQVEDIYIDGVAYIDDLSAEDAVLSGNLQFQTSIYASGHNSGVTTLGTTVTPLTSANIAFALIRRSYGTPGAQELPDGVTGKVIILELLADPAWILNGGTTTKTGWETITFDTAYDKITLLWADDTYGWIIVNNDGCAITR